MEFGISKQIYAFSHRPDMSYRPPFNSSTPSKTFINPGVGASFNLFAFYVPLHAADPFKIQKQIDPVDQPLTQPGQSGSGTDEKEAKVNESVENSAVRSQMDPKVYQSFQHPNSSFIKTDKIFKNFQKRKVDIPEPAPKKVRRDNADIKHKFQFH